MSGPIKNTSSSRMPCVFVPAVEMWPKYRPTSTMMIDANARLSKKYFIVLKIILLNNINNTINAKYQCCKQNIIANQPNSC